MRILHAEPRQVEQHYYASHYEVADGGQYEYRPSLCCCRYPSDVEAYSNSYPELKTNQHPNP